VAIDFDFKHSQVRDNLSFASIFPANAHTLQREGPLHNIDNQFNVTAGNILNSIIISINNTGEKAKKKRKNTVLLCVHLQPESQEGA
jgi:homoserine acetyltransferase